MTNWNGYPLKNGKITLEKVSKSEPTSFKVPKPIFFQPGESCNSKASWECYKESIHVPKKKTNFIMIGGIIIIFLLIIIIIIVKLDIGSSVINK